MAFITLHFTAMGQLLVGEGFTAKVLVGNVLVGDGIQTQNIKYTGHSRAMALFENGDRTDLGLDKGIILGTGIASKAKGPNNVSNHSDSLGWPGDKVLESIAGYKTRDAAILQFDFKPQTEAIEFKYIFSSEEYIKYVDKGFNDVFGFFISGPGITGEQNVALIPGSNLEVSIDNVNHKRNTDYFILNDDSGSNRYKYLQHNGQTVVLKANLNLQPCQWYTIKLAISDVGDAALDSWVFIGSKSFKHKTDIGKDTAFCSENFLQTLDAGHPGRKVLWSTGERTQQIQVSGYGTYWVEVFTECGSFKDEVNILPAIRPIDLGNDTLICGNEVDRVLEIKDRVFDKYLWSTGDTTPTIRVKQSGEYWLKVGRDGCFTEDTIEIQDIPIPEFSLGNDTLICGDIDISLKPNISADDFTWFDGSKIGIKKITEPGQYWLRADKGVCHFIDTIEVTNLRDFDVDIGPPTLTYCEQRNVRLSTQINDTSIYSVRWNTGDEVGAITVNESGLYSVIVTDKVCGYRSSDECELNFLSEGLRYYVPNAFTPNGDGLNETIGPVFMLSDAEDYLFAIYDRWGEKVFETTHYGDRWDGTVNGKPAPEGVYMWRAVIKTDCLPDQERYQKGSLTILR